MPHSVYLAYSERGSFWFLTIRGWVQGFAVPIPNDLVLVHRLRGGRCTGPAHYAVSDES